MGYHGPRPLELTVVSHILVSMWGGSLSLHWLFLSVTWVNFVYDEHFQSQTYQLNDISISAHMIYACNGEVDRSTCLFSMRTVVWWILTHQPCAWSLLSSFLGHLCIPLVMPFHWVIQVMWLHTVAFGELALSYPLQCKSLSCLSLLHTIFHICDLGS